MTAMISECGRYRYMLQRMGDLACTKRPAFWCALNPSKADALIDDNSVRRMFDFSMQWGCQGFKLGNLYAGRATKPIDLWKYDDPIGPENDNWLYLMAREAKSVVCAWGANAKPDRVAHVVEIFQRANAKLLCLGTNKDGSPKHPLYLRRDSKLIEWSFK